MSSKKFGLEGRRDKQLSKAVGRHTELIGKVSSKQLIQACRDLFSVGGERSQQGSGEGCEIKGRSCRQVGLFRGAGGGAFEMRGAPVAGWGVEGGGVAERRYWKVG